MNPPNWLRAIGRVSLWVWAVLGLLFLFTPILVTVIFSFNEPSGKYNYVWDKFSLSGWTDPFKYPELTDALIFSLKIAVVVTAIATVLGTLMGLAMVKYKFRAKGTIGAILILPLTMPEIVLGFSLLTLFVSINWSRGFITIVIAQVMFSVSYVATTVRARIRGFDWRLEEASLDLGASAFRTFYKVTLPLIAPGVVAAAMLTFALSLDDFIITYLNSGLDNTFPIQIWNMKRSKIPVQINVFSTALLIISIVLAALLVVFNNRRAQKLAGLSDS
ncbi:MAG TPA: ABC transporter permease [Acidimicrobiaceae bacterium]|jgi:spermidine/putrescine transport system permease protein|nr:ABC transporter permease [Acidimicrobiaceae bacterium]